MVTVDTIKETLDANTFITDEVKNNLFELVIIFNNKYPDVDLSNLNNRLATLNISSANQYITKEAADYNIKNNTILINTKKIEEDGYDVKHLLMAQLLKITTVNGNNYGFDNNNALTALNIGITELIASNLVGNDINIEQNPHAWRYADEMITANLITHVVDSDELTKAYFNNDNNAAIGLLIRNYISKDLIDMMNYNLYNRPGINILSKSQLGQIQMGIIEAFEKKGNLDLEKISSFKANLYGKSSSFAPYENMYGSIDYVYNYYNRVVEQPFKLNIEETKQR